MKTKTQLAERVDILAGAPIRGKKTSSLARGSGSYLNFFDKNDFDILAWDLLGQKIRQSAPDNATATNNNPHFSDNLRVAFSRVHIVVLDALSGR
jgi:hypothetical protein